MSLKSCHDPPLLLVPPCKITIDRAESVHLTRNTIY